MGRGKKSTCASTNGLDGQISTALMRLAKALDHASDAGRDRWDFAVEIQELLAVGLTTSDLRWLVCKGYVEHAREITLPGEEGRAFHPTGNLTFVKRTCFVLTAAGLSVVRGPSTAASASCRTGSVSPVDGSHGKDKRLIPHWDPELHELRLDGQLVKQFKLPSRNQETVLAAFEEEGWPARIDDPLPPRHTQNAKRRLQDTIKGLNRNQKNRLVRIMGDGTGLGIRWELISRD